MQKSAIATIVLAACAQSQPPTSRPLEAADKTERQGSVKKTDSSVQNKLADDFSSMVDKVAVELARRNQQQPSPPEQTKPPKDLWAIWNTGLNTLFAGCLVVLMFRQWKAMDKTLKETQKAADAAKSSAETADLALRTSARAVVAIDSIQMKSDSHYMQLQTPMDRFANSYVEVTMKNFGPTIANRFYYEIRICIKDPANFTNPMVSSATILQPGTPVKEKSHLLGGYFSPDAIVDAVESRELRVNGFIRYRDVFDRGWKVDFFSLFDSVTNDFRILSTIEDEGMEPK